MLHIIFSYRFSLPLWFIKDCTYVPFLWSLSSFCLVVIFRFICIMAYNFYFYGISLFVNKYVFSCLSVSRSFPWICFVLFRYAKFCLICYILLYYYPLDACLFFWWESEWDGSRWEGKWGKLGAVEGEKTVIRIYYMGKSIFNKRKKFTSIQIFQYSFPVSTPFYFLIKNWFEINNINFPFSTPNPSQVHNYYFHVCMYIYPT